LYVSPGTFSVPADAPVVDIGTVTWTPSDAGRTTRWKIGEADRTGGEFSLGRAPRGWFLPGLVPGDLTFTIGESKESEDWYYAQTEKGTWTVAFNLPAAQTGTAFLTISASLTDGDSPTVAVNGDASGISGAVPSGTDSTLSRQTVRSGFPRAGTLTFDAARLKAGANTITFTRAAAQGNNTGLGYDCIKLQVA
jgi:rhamnogalacturonan endolyase